MNLLPTPERAVYALADLQDWPAVTAGLELPLRLAVCGDPVAHSASPPMHNAALAAAGLPMRYTRLHLRPDELGPALRLLAPQGFLGVNLTLPHKAAALALLDDIDPAAEDMGAVNTIVVDPGGSGRLRGFNTDGPGMARAVREAFGVELGSLRVLLLGAGGGAGRALAAQCTRDGCPALLLANRTLPKAQALAQRLPRAEAVIWEPAALATAAARVDLVINASSVGLKDADASPLPASCLAGRLVFDTVYRASGAPTPLLSAANEADARAVGGRALLLHQGALAFERWFNQPAPLEPMRRALENQFTRAAS